MYSKHLNCVPECIETLLPQEGKKSGTESCTWPMCKSSVATNRAVLLFSHGRV